MTPAELELCGHLLYGLNWQRALARSINVNKDTVTNWKFGKTKIKPEMENKIMRLLENREKMIHSLIAFKDKKESKKLEKFGQHYA